MTAVTPDLLGDKSLRAKIEIVGENGPADGLIISKHDGDVRDRSADQQHRGPRPRSQGRQADDGSADDTPHWPDTFSEGSDGTIFFTTSHIQDSAFYKEGAPIALPTELWSFKPTR